MKKLKVGDIVGDGAGSRGRIVRIEHNDPTRFASNEIREEIYVEWGYTAPLISTEGCDNMSMR